MNALVTTTTVAAPVVSAKALTIAFDARDAAIVRAQELAVAVKAKRAELDLLVAQAHDAAWAVTETTRAWADAMRVHALSVEVASEKLLTMFDEEMDDACCDAVLAFDPNAV